VALSIEAKQIHGVVGVRDQHAGAISVRLDGQHAPRLILPWWVRVSRTRHELVERHAVSAVSVGEPRAVGDFTEGISVL